MKIHIFRTPDGRLHSLHVGSRKTAKKALQIPDLQCQIIELYFGVWFPILIGVLVGAIMVH